MSRGLAVRLPACGEHPHRAAIDHCDECRRGYCRQCLVRGGPQLLCRRCWAAAPERERIRVRRRHRLYRRLDWIKENRASAVAAGVIAGVLGLLAISGAAQVASSAWQAQAGDAVVAVRRAAPLPPSQNPGGAGAGAAASQVPTLVLGLYGSASAIAELAPGTDAAALVDGQIGPAVRAWRSPSGFVTADLRFRVRDTAPAARVLFAHSRAVPPETWAREVEVWVAITFEGLDGPEAIRLGRWTLAQTTGAQVFDIPPARVAGARLRVLSNYGSAEYTSLAEFALLPPSR